MKTRFTLLFVAAILALSCGSALAQSSISPQKKALILEFLEATGGKKQSAEMMDLMLAMQVTETHKVLASIIDEDKISSPAQKSKMKKEMIESSERSSNRVREFFSEQLNIGELVEEITVPVYDKHFTENELQDLINFYRTPTGKKLVSVTPMMALETMGAFSEKVMPKLQEFMKKAVDSELALLKEKVKPASKK